MTENRNIARRRVLKAGKIAFNQAGIIDCTVRNISETGACLQVASPLGIPESFNLILNGEPAPKPCRVVWRKEKQIGVEFQ